MTSAFDEIVESSDPPMVLVTASAGGRDAGCLVGFHCQSSIEPERWTVWISKANHTYAVIQEAESVGVLFLTADDLRLAELFGSTTGDEVDKFARCATERRFGVPMPSDCAHWMVGRPVGIHDDGGDHVGVSIEPFASASSGPFAALRLAAVDHLDPGHAAEDLPRGEDA